MSADQRIVVRRRAVVEYLLLIGAALAMRWSSGPAGALLGSLAVAAGAAVSVGLHEGAHALVARLSGLRVIGLEVRGLLEASVRRAATPDARVDLRVRLAGPAATALLVAGCSAGLHLSLSGDSLRLVRLLVALNAFALVMGLFGGHDSDGMRAWRIWRAL